MTDQFARYRDVLGQLTFVKTYTHILLAFRTSPGVSREDIISNLHAASKAMTDAMPWLGGHVVREGADPTTQKSGLTKVVSYPPGERDSLVIFKDLTDTFSSLDALLAEGAPMTMLDGAPLNPRKALPESYDEAAEGPAPVLVVQASFIDGGLLLGFAANHNMMDFNGCAIIISGFAKAARGAHFTKQEIDEANFDRRDAIKLLSPEEMKLRDVARYRVKPQPEKEAASEGETKPAVEWVYFRFRGDKLRELKKAVSAAGLEGTDKWASTDDILSVLIGITVLSARVKRLGSPPSREQATLVRAVNARRFLDPPLPKGYTGHTVWCVHTKVDLSREGAAAAANDPESLGRVATQLRHDLQGIDPLDIQAFATALDAEDDKGL